jgi:predicted ATPase
MAVIASPYTKRQGYCPTPDSRPPGPSVSSKTVRADYTSIHQERDRASVEESAGRPVQRYPVQERFDLLPRTWLTSASASQRSNAAGLQPRSATSSLCISGLLSAQATSTARLRAGALRPATTGSSAAVLVQHDLPSGVTMRDLGEHRLKDLPRPEHLYQVAVEGLPADFPSLATLAATPNNLAIQLTRFIGRERELEETRALLLNARLVTILGAGGLGKTRLSIELAERALGVFKAGVWFVDLAGISDGSLVPHALATVLGVRESGHEPLESTLSRHLAPQRALILLDNCEHLVENCARLAQVLLQRCPLLAILATSREALGVPGEVVWRLTPLALPDGERSDAVEELGRSEAVALFVDRATLADPSFRLDAGNSVYVVRICSRLDGIPLALELAAARISVMSVEDLASKLEDRFRVLRSGSRTAVPRQQTLQATIDWSHELLTDPERALFRRLSLFAGGFSLESAEIVCSSADLDRADIVDVLSRLVDKSLVLSGGRAGGRTRYRMLETIREYGSERLRQAAEAPEIRRRHAEYYLRLAEEGEGALRAEGQFEWLQRLGQELDNFRVALAWAQEHDPGLGLRLAATLVGYWFTRGLVREGRDWLDRFLAASVPDDQARPKALNGAGLLASAQGAIEDARRLLEESIGLATGSRDRQSLATGLSYLGMLEAVCIGAAAAGREHLQGAISLCREIGDRPGEAFSVFYLGLNEYYSANLVEGRELLQRSLDLLVELGDRTMSLRPMFFLGLVAFEVGDVAGARARWRQALAFSSELRDTWTIAFEIDCFAALAASESRPERAMTLAGAAEMVRSTFGLTWPPLWRAKVERWVTSVREQLGTRSEEALARGRSMTLDAAIAYAMEER